MKLFSIIKLILLNAVLITLFLLARQDVLWRMNYWSSIGFSSNFSFSILTFVISSSKDGNSIPGLLTLDWSQVFLFLLIIVDAGLIVQFFRKSTEVIVGTGNSFYQRNLVNSFAKQKRLLLKTSLK